MRRDQLVDWGIGAGVGTVAAGLLYAGLRLLGVV